jgi:hypothetical protein
MSEEKKEEFLNFLKVMIQKYPNDQDLGKQIRLFFLSQTKKN